MKKQIALILSAALTVGLCGCGKDTKVSTADIDLSQYPIKTDVELSYWVPLTANISTVASDLGKTEFAKKLKEVTGVTVNYIHPALGQENEAFNLMVASGELPDIIEYSWFNFTGGPTMALNNEVITPLNDLMKKYAPSLSKYLSENPEYDKACKTDSGTYYSFPFIRNDKKLLTTQGPVFRQDWLDELGLDAPKSIDEWETVLTAFRDKKGCTAPLTVAASIGGTLYNIFDATISMYVDGDTIKYGPIEPEFKNAVTQLNKWYSEKLLDKNFSMVDTTILDSNMLNGVSGATFGSGGQNIGKWLSAKAGDSNYKLTAVDFPTRADGSQPRFNFASLPIPGGGSAAITTKCRYPELAAKYLDYLYTDEGHILANFGIEGESFNWENDYPTYTDKIMKNSEGLSPSQAMSMYLRANGSGPFVQDVRYIEQYYQTETQKQALDTWSKSTDNTVKYLMPQLSHDTDEASEYAGIYNEINKYVHESAYAFISGSKSLDEFDAFVEQIKKMNIARAIEIKQKAYDNYLKR